jgi:hypothetical protein
VALGVPKEAPAGKGEPQVKWGTAGRVLPGGDASLDKPIKAVASHM